MDSVIYEQDEHIVTITMNSPERLNAMSEELVNDLDEAWTRFILDDSAWVAIITGAGRAFQAGRDLKAEAAGRKRQPRPEREIDVPYSRLHMPETSKPIIAAINGYAVGYGWFMMNGSDIRVAAESATFAMTEVPTGLIGPFYLSINDTVPWTIAAEIALLGEFWSAQRLYELGMVNKVVPDDQLMDAAREYAERFVSLPQEVMRKTKELMLKTRQWPRGEVKEEHIRSQEWLSSRPDTKEAVRAFVEKRQAKFSGSDGDRREA